MDNLRAPVPRARWRVLGAYHGDEASSGEVVLSAAWRLCQGYGLDETITELLESDAVWLVPHVNPDGIELDSRYNARDVDLNRNYDYQWSLSEYRAGPEPFSEPETRAIRTLGAWVGFGAGLSAHSGAANIGWVWNYTTDPAPDAGLVESMAQSYADDCSVEGFWATNGADWYITYGDTNDWLRECATLDALPEAAADEDPRMSRFRKKGR